MATTQELKDALRQAVDAEDEAQAASIMQQLRQTPRVAPVPTDDYLGQRAAQQANAIVAARNAAAAEYDHLGATPPVQIYNEQELAKQLEATGEGPYADLRKELIKSPAFFSGWKAPTKQSALTDVRNLFEHGTSPFESRSRAMIQGGHRFDQMLRGLANVGDFVAGAIARPFSDSAYANRMDSIDARVAEDAASSKLREDITSDTGVAGAVGEFLPYYLSGVAAGPVLSKAFGGLVNFGTEAVAMPARAAGRQAGGINDWFIQKGASAAARTRAMAEAGIVPPRLVTPTLGIDTAAIRPLVDKVTPTLVEPNRWLARELVEPIRGWRAAKIASKGDAPLLPLYKNTANNIGGMTALGAAENALDSEKEVLAGAIQGLAGGVAGSLLRGKVSNALDPKKPNPYVTQEETDMMKRLYRDYGIDSDIGMVSGLPSEQVAMANFRHRPRTQNMAKVYDSNNARKEANLVADALGMPRPTGNGFTHQMFADHMTDIDKRFRGIEESSTGQFTPDIMARVNTHVANLGRDITLPVDVKDFANQTRLAMHGYQNPDRTFQARSFSDPEMQAIDKQLKKIAKSVPELPRDRDQYDEFFQRKADAWRDLERLRAEYNAMKTDPLVSPEELESAKQWGIRARDKFNAMDNFERAAARYPKHSAAALQKSVEDIRKLLGFNTQTQAASNFLTPDALKVINGHISAIETKIASGSPKFAPYKATAKEHRALLDALSPLKMNLASVDDAGVVTLDGLRLKNLREDVNSKINDLMALNRGADARALRPLLYEIDQATRYNPNHPLIPNAEAAAATRRDYALSQIAADNRFINAGMRPDPAAITKYMESPEELGNLLQGKHTVPQKQAMYDLAAYHRLRESQRRSTQNNIGSIEEENNRLLRTPAASQPTIAEQLKFRLHTKGLGPLPKGWPGTTGYLNMNHDGPWSIYPVMHGAEQATDVSGRTIKAGRKAKQYLTNLWGELNK